MVRRLDNAGRVQEHPPRLERPRSARDRRTDPHPAAVRARPRLERDPGAAQQLPPVPVRPVVVDAQRVARQVPGDEARPDDGGGPVIVRRDRGIDRHRDPVLPGPHLRPGGRPAQRGRPRGRPHRRSRPPPRNRVPGPHDGGRQRRRIDLGVPLLQREEHELALLLDRRDPAAAAVSGSGGPRPVGSRSPLRSSPSHCATYREHGTRSRRVRGVSCGPGEDEIQPFLPLAART